ncbi:MAG: HipA N-terminal domain-containing protein [Bacteroidales bacterium]|nr:HipA N-terminal domain-containing protein [Bacteroidales bacterium]
MNSTDKLTVMMHGRMVGTLVLTPDSRQASFRYSQEWLHDGFSISPLNCRLKTSFSSRSRCLSTAISAYLKIRFPTREDLVACGATIRITPARCNEMIDEIWNA